MVKETKNNTDKWYFLTHDHLGSIHCILNENGYIEQELSFDPFGNRRDPLTWQPFEDNTEPAYLLDRGYTMHEHWDNFSLINMNGRVYDPVIARFLSPDPFIQSPDFTQNFNRYSYVLNNPLIYTDPSGEFAFTAALIAAGIAMVVDYGIQVAVNYAQNPNGTFKENFYDNIDYFDIAVSGVMGFFTAGFGASASATTRLGRNIYRINRYVVPLIKAKVDIKGNEGLVIKSDAEALLNYGTSMLMNRAVRKSTERFSEIYKTDGLITALQKSIKPAIVDGTANVVWDRIYTPSYEENIQPYLTQDDILIVPPTNRYP